MFRGLPTGDLPDPSLSNIEQCQKIPRCLLALETRNSTLVNAKLVMEDVPALNALSLPSQTIGEPISQQGQLAYKAVIMIEGNDVSTGLKWAMLSKSIVVMPRPAKSSWFMEELLQPYVHYVPIKPDMSDVDAQVRWIVDNDKLAHRIAIRGSMWVNDMLFHDDAEEEERQIEREILSRYEALFI